MTSTRSSPGRQTFVLSLLGVFCLIALASIGLFVIPVAVLLACATLVTTRGDRQTCAAQRSRW